MKIKIISLPKNASKWKHGLGGYLFEEGGPKVTLVDSDKVRMNDSGTFSDDNGNIIGDSVVIPNITIRAHKGYKSTYDMNLVNVPTTKQEIRKRLYENINPYDYGNAAIRVAKAVIGNTKEETISDGYYMPEVDDLWATYLQIPKSERHTENELVNEGHRLKVLPGIYKPTKGIGSGKYYRLNLNEDSKKAIVDEAMGNTYEVGFDVSPNPYNNHLALKRIEKDPINIGQNRVATSYDRTLNLALRDFTVGRGRDNKGDYVSYYDLWDLSPYRISSKDQSFGIGNPFEIYGRIHLDDYYGVPKKYRGGNYLPEIIITGKEKEKAFGGNLLGGGAYSGLNNPNEMFILGTVTKEKNKRKVK